MQQALKIHVKFTQNLLRSFPAILEKKQSGQQGKKWSDPWWTGVSREPGVQAQKINREAVYIFLPYITHPLTNLKFCSIFFDTECLILSRILMVTQMSSSPTIWISSVICIRSTVCFRSCQQGEPCGSKGQKAPEVVPNRRRPWRAQAKVPPLLPWARPSSRHQCACSGITPTTSDQQASACSTVSMRMMWSCEAQRGTHEHPSKLRAAHIIFPL